MKSDRCRAAWGLCVVALLAGLAGCASLPLPGTPDEALVVLPTEITSETWPDGDGTRRIVGGRLYFISSELGHEYPVSFAPGKPYVALAVPPGQYYLMTVVVDNQWANSAKRYKNDWQDRNQLSMTFYAGPNSVQILGRSFYVARKDRGYRIGFTGTIPTETRSGISEALKADRRWSAWEECQLVNFE